MVNLEAECVFIVRRRRSALDDRPGRGACARCQPTLEVRGVGRWRGVSAACRLVPEPLARYLRDAHGHKHGRAEQRPVDHRSLDPVAELPRFLLGCEGVIHPGPAENASAHVGGRLRRAAVVPDVQGPHGFSCGQGGFRSEFPTDRDRERSITLLVDRELALRAQVDKGDASASPDLGALRRDRARVRWGCLGCCPRLDRAVRPTGRADGLAQLECDLVSDRRAHHEERGNNKPDHEDAAEVLNGAGTAVATKTEVSTPDSPDHAIHETSFGVRVGNTFMGSPAHR